MNSARTQIILRLAMNRRAKAVDAVIQATSATPSSVEGVPSRPPRRIPEPLLDGYTMGGKVPLRYCYLDESVPDGKALHLTSEDYQMYFATFAHQRFPYYGYEGYTFFEAQEHYPFKNKDIIIYGLAGCNCDAFALWAGARQLHIVEYNPVICEHEKVSVHTPAEFARKGVQADCAISYSSFEHDGLGRYGDPLNPDGDLEAMAACHRSLKMGGLLFLGIPLGQDCVVFNAHRIYGRHRLPLLLKGYALLDVFTCYRSAAPEFPFRQPLGEYRDQMLLVLQTIDTDWPDDDWLLARKASAEKNAATFRNHRILSLINKFIHDHKHGLAA